MTPPESEHFLFELRIEPTASIAVGSTPAGMRQVDMLAGSFEGPALKGRLVVGVDRLTRGNDGRFRPDAYLLLETDSGEKVELSYRGVADLPEQQFAAILRGEKLSYYHRIVATFSTASAKLDWLNASVAVGQGQIFPMAGGNIGVTYKMTRVT